MREKLQEKGALFVENKRIMEKGFAWQGGGQHLLSAAVFTMSGRRIELEKIKAARELIRRKTSVFSSFRSYTELALATFLSIEEDPKTALEKTIRVYEKIKKGVWDTSFLPVISFILSETIEEQEAEHIGKKAVEIYKGMEKNHPFLTGPEDFNYALLFAITERSAQGCLREMEDCYESLVTVFGKRNSTQALSHILGLGEENTADKTGRAVGIYERLREKGMKYPREEAVVMLGILALSITDEQMEEAADDLIEIHDWLKEQKGFGAFSMSSAERMMYAGLLTADSYAQEYKNSGQTVLTNSLVSILIAEVTALLAVAMMLTMSGVSSTAE